jgi:hypothetical protein
MKYFTLLFFLIPFLAFTQNMEQFESEALGFLIEYPADWHMEEGPNAFLFSSAGPDESDGGSFGIGFSPVVEIPGETLEERFEMFRQAMLSDPGPGITIGEIEEIEIGGNRALRQTEKVKYEATSVITSIMGLDVEDSFYFVITSIEPMELEAQIQPLLSMILSSIEFFPPASMEN